MHNILTFIFSDEMMGSFLKIKERNLKLVTRTVTAKAEEQNIKDDNYIPTSGHLMFLKNKVVDGEDLRAQMISLGGVRMSEGRTWSMASTLMSRTLEITDDGLTLGDLTTLKSFQVTASHKNKTSKGSVTPNLMNATAVDLESDESFLMKVVIYGGQFTDAIVTSDEVITICGMVRQDINNSDIQVTRYPAKAYQYKEFVVPNGWSTGNELVQKGQVPTSRTGGGFTKLRSTDGTDYLLSTGGHSKTRISRPFFHPDDSLNLLSFPEMSWKRLEDNDYFKRSFHSQSVNSAGEVFIVGGMTLIDGKWSKIHPLNEVIKITFEEDFSYSGTVLKIQSDIRELSFLTNFSFAAHENKLFFFSGFKYPKYENDNLHLFLPPHTSRDKLPELGRNLFKVDLDEGTVIASEGPEDCGGNNGSIVMLNAKEMIITSDPHIYFHSERMAEPPKCDLPVAFGSCSLPMTSKNRSRYRCATPACKNMIHIKCDKSIRGNKCSDNKVCPSCADLDPKTWKKSKAIRLPNRK